MRFPRAIGIQLGLLGLVSALLLAVACGPAATPTPTPAPTPTPTTVAPLPAATPTATAAIVQATPTPTPTRAAAPPTATPTPTPAPIASPTPTPVAVPAPKAKAGTIFLAVPEIPAGVGLNRSQAPDELLYWSGGEAFMRPSGYDYVTPSLAVAWKLAPDLSKVTLTLRQGVQFHKGWGEMTAEDAVWSINDANGAVTKESIHGQAGDFAPIFGAAKVVSKYEMELSITNFDPRWDSNFLNHAGQALSILSKRLYDEKGADYARENIVATGPFQVREWLR
ncbi:MAG: ABC transporter substrate-binding protein, partial [Chloroflexota bacterium]|nr:ABC transporter substrate-binding protein [Chloroflexota bacterium]